MTDQRLAGSKTFSIVVPVYFNAANLPATISRLLALRDRLPDYRLELLCVDDGSGDDSLAVLRAHQAQHPDCIKVVKLTRNFGAMAAVQAGLSLASGDCVGMIASDLQDPPELFVDMIRHWQNGIKAVFAVRAARAESALQRLFSGAYYRLMRLFALPQYPRGGFDFFLIDRRIVDQLKTIDEKNTNLMSLIFWLGYQYVTIPYERTRREVGRSRWTLSKKVKLFVDSFVAFSYAPIRFVSLIGLLFAGFAFAYGMLVLYTRLSTGIEVKGWAPIIILLAFTSGLQMTMLGLLGEYLWRTLDEVRKRPPYVIEDVYER
jgi:dolichol-phosphate mannosyltransferase